MLGLLDDFGMKMFNHLESRKNSEKFTLNNEKIGCLKNWVGKRLR